MATPEESENPRDLKMSLMEHLGELRSRLLRCTLSVVVLGGVALFFSKSLYGILMRPVLVSLPPEAAQLIYTSAIEEINVYMKVGLYGGLFLSTPVILWQIWGFVAPGLYASERKMAAPFVVLGSLAFIGGVMFAYFVMLPPAFSILLKEEGVTALSAKLDTGRLREQDALRYLRLGDVQSAGRLAKQASADLLAEGGRTTQGDMGITLVPKKAVDLVARLDGLGRLVDATHDGLGSSARPVLARVMERRIAATDAFGRGDFGKAETLADEAAAILASADLGHAQEFGQLWGLERELGLGKARYESLNWTKPMLSMTEQLTLILVVELALGVIFELPIVMALLGAVGLVKAKWLMKYQRHAFIACLLVASVITPTGDAINLAMMAGPMLACYELGVLAVWIIEKRRNAREASAVAAE
ncbi:MAG: twin-arginine translocase subunit TatC [Myxococcaceae bacterium]